MIYFSFQLIAKLLLCVLVLCLSRLKLLIQFENTLALVLALCPHLVTLVFYLTHNVRAAFYFLIKSLDHFLCLFYSFTVKMKFAFQVSNV